MRRKRFQRIAHEFWNWFGQVANHDGHLHWRLYEGENPASRVKPCAMRSRTRFAQPKEMPLLMQALKRENEMTQCYFLLCLLVGCRRTEGLTMKWEDLDIEACMWNKPRTKTGIPHTIPVPALMARIAALPQRNEFVFSTLHGHWSPSRAYGKWNAIRRCAGLADVTIHDLRRSARLGWRFQVRTWQ